MTGKHHQDKLLLIEMWGSPTNILLRLASNHDPLNLLLLSSWITGMNHCARAEWAKNGCERLKIKLLL
jgi:hypothetical protein